MKRTGSNINGQNIDSNAADRTAQPGSLSAANHGNPDATYSDPVKAPAFNRRTLGVASVLGLLFSSLLAFTLFFASADNSASQSPKFDAKTVSENTIFAFAQLKPADFSTANSFYHSDLDPADVSSNQKSGGGRWQSPAIRELLKLPRLKVALRIARARNARALLVYPPGVPR